MLSDPIAAAAWLAGFIDGEGCVHERTGRNRYGRYHHRRITICNTDKALADAAENCFALLGIRTRRSDKPGAKEGYRHRYYVDVVHRDEFEKVLRLIPIQAPEKRRKLEALVAGLPSRLCKGCGCHRDERTRGCAACEQRHGWRRRHNKGRFVTLERWPSAEAA